MANPRRASYSTTTDNPFLISVKHFFKKPHAFPLLLLLFVLLTWLTLRLQHPSNNVQDPTTKWVQQTDENANLVRFKATSFPSDIVKDNRGWFLNPVSLALHHGIKGGAVSCASIHVGEIRRHTFRGNHRHHTCNETFVIWGAKTLFRVENNQIADKGYAEVVVGADEVAVAASPSGRAHVLMMMHLNVHIHKSRDTLLSSMVKRIEILCLACELHLRC